MKTIKPKKRTKKPARFEVIYGGLEAANVLAWNAYNTGRAKLDTAKRYTAKIKPDGVADTLTLTLTELL